MARARPITAHERSDSGIDIDESQLLLLGDEKRDFVLDLVEEEGFEAGDEVEASPASGKQSRFALSIWLVLNCVSTIFIVFLNRSVLTSQHFKGAPTFFVAFHFACTSLCMYALSVKSIGLVQPKSIPWRPLVPVCLVCGLKTVITNASLALLAVPTYQLMRVLLTPATILLELGFYGKRTSWAATVCLAVVCTGVAVMTVADTASKATLRQDTISGYIAGLTGVILASLYTIWIGRHHERFQVNSMQLLYVMSPLATLFLWCACPLVDHLPNWMEVTPGEWLALSGSGLCAIAINVSQFFIVAETSAVAASVVGHVKTCLIVAIGYGMSGSISLECGVGIVSALCGICAYSYVTFKG